MISNFQVYCSCVLNIYISRLAFSLYDYRKKYSTTLFTKDGILNSSLTIHLITNLGLEMNESSSFHLPHLAVHLYHLRFFFFDKLPFTNHSYYPVQPFACTLIQSLLISQPNLVAHFSCPRPTILQLISVTISTVAFTIITLSLFFCSALSYPNFNSPLISNI